jgi:uncharacterized membrane protein
MGIFCVFYKVTLELSKKVKFKCRAGFSCMDAKWLGYLGRLVRSIRLHIDITYINICLINVESIKNISEIFRSYARCVEPKHFYK